MMSLSTELAGTAEGISGGMIGLKVDMKGFRCSGGEGEPLFGVEVAIGGVEEGREEGREAFGIWSVGKEGGGRAAEKPETL